MSFPELFTCFILCVYKQFHTVFNKISRRYNFKHFERSRQNVDRLLDKKKQIYICVWSPCGIVVSALDSKAGRRRFEQSQDEYFLFGCWERK